jgi:hypothetical protein
MRHEVTRGGGEEKLHNKELHNMHLQPSIIRMINSRRMGWAGHVALMKRGTRKSKTLWVDR